MLHTINSSYKFVHKLISFYWKNRRVQQRAPPCSSPYNTWVGRVINQPPLTRLEKYIYISMIIIVYNNVGDWRFDPLPFGWQWSAHDVGVLVLQAKHLLLLRDREVRRCEAQWREGNRSGPVSGAPVTMWWLVASVGLMVCGTRDWHEDLACDEVLSSIASVDACWQLWSWGGGGIWTLSWTKQLSIYWKIMMDWLVKWPVRCWAQLTCASFRRKNS